MKISIKLKIIIPVIILFIFFIGVSQYFTFKSFKHLTLYFLKNDLQKTIKNFQNLINETSNKNLYI